MIKAKEMGKMVISLMISHFVLLLSVYFSLSPTN